MDHLADEICPFYPSDLRWSLTQHQAQYIAALFQSTPIPLSKKELKKQNPILDEVAARKAMVDLALERRWLENDDTDRELFRVHIIQLQAIR